MSVIVVADPGLDPAPFAGWGKRFAEARGLQLEILLVSGTEIESPDLDPDSGAEFKTLVADDLFHAVQAEVGGRNPELVILARHQLGREGKAAKRLAQRLFAALPCDTLMLRAGTDPSGPGACDSVLVPVSGGPHSPGGARLGAGPGGRGPLGKSRTDVRRTG